MKAPHLVVTTINNPTDALVSNAVIAADYKVPFLVIGDSKTPKDFNLPAAEFVSIEDQSEIGSTLADSLPQGTYSRKMLGYIVALRRGASHILETDDDNFLNQEFFSLDFPLRGAAKSPGNHFLNHYKLFSSAEIWPRGFPLDGFAEEWRAPEIVALSDAGKEPSAILGEALVQGLADGNPDVDAVFRLSRPSFNYEGFAFEPAGAVFVPGKNRSWLPLNSQVTIWPRKLAPLMYLPTTCSFRMTDIWRGYVAQRVFHELDIGILLPGALAFQKRNDHDLIQDFSQEVEGYLGYRNFISILDRANLSGLSPAQSIEALYVDLIQEGFFEPTEMQFLTNWLTDIADI